VSLGFDLIELLAHGGETAGLLGIEGQVVFFLLVIGQIEQLFKIMLGPIEVFSILPHQCFGGGNEVDPA
jgi:hypothetical protein